MKSMVPALTDVPVNLLANEAASDVLMVMADKLLEPAMDEMS